MIKYEAKITAIGPLVSEFLDHDIMVLFGQSAPEELAEFSVVHDGQTLRAPLAAGDTVCIGEACVQVLAVGDVASDNLANLGHLVLKFNGASEIEMPGDVCVEKRTLPLLEVGMAVRVSGD
ncbi:MAG: PTS glucitol/sorbitol transporter subunit IIA [Chloroflexota bacterium]